MSDLVNHVEKMRSNILAMNSLSGFSVIIVCCSNSFLSNYWQNRLEGGRGSVIAQDTVVLTVFEDWPGGAGNGLGTLYAFQNAAKLAQEKHGMDLSEQLRSGKISVGLYHTAGKGTRLAPLPGAENNNKPGVKLPGIISVGGKSMCITILESVIKQTGCYASSRLGRVSVFWGDQIFIPTVDVAYTCTDHVDILCTLGPMLSAEEWAAKGMDKYGLIAKMADGRGAQVEKVSHATAVDLLSGLGEIRAVGASLGSFSVSAAMLAALLEEFAQELAAKAGKLDTDPHFWMPMTLERASYISLMATKKVAADEAGAHWDRIRAMLQKNSLVEFPTQADPALTGLFGACDVGQNIYWWDYGQLKYYQKYLMLIAEKGEEGELMRLFFTSTSSSSTSSYVLNSTLPKEAAVTGSVVCNVRCTSLQADGCILVNVVARSITAAPGSIIYNVTTDGDLVATEDSVQVGVWDGAGEQIVIRSSMDTDGGDFWDKPAVEGQRTFGEIYKSNEVVDPAVVETAVETKQAAAWAAIQN